MKTVIYNFIYWVAAVHDSILSINDSRSFYLNDKQLHFLVIGITGLLMIFIIYPIFKKLAQSGHTMVIAWIYVFTVILVLTFAIEIGQWYSGTGKMDAGDIAYGVMGFLVVFAFFAVIRGIWHAILRLIEKWKKKASSGDAPRH